MNEEGYIGYELIPKHLARDSLLLCKKHKLLGKPLKEDEIEDCEIQERTHTKIIPFPKRRATWKLPDPDPIAITMIA